MPFRSLDDLRYLIEDELPRQADLPVKANPLPKERAEHKQHGSRVVPDEVYADRIVRAMAETGCRSDPDDDGPETNVWLPRFRLRH
jgi:hypothetical protein